MRQSRTSGSVGGLGGNSQAYPTTVRMGLLVAGPWPTNTKMADASLKANVPRCEGP